ncbi:Monosaccharide-transporting ATPase [Gluconacetobacter diazotrophicus PA1 5]|nr:sugar ABC transporter permease [Gluconacetobacter diazotrophicus]ACI50564.1 Monosaccharide-transporting ATPase [Gluconacetobacter diazotrophicus PA1 5]TWB09396.1 xylose ABC transporter membrane protein [Gluconacetobacter diazotrophicus]
MTIPNTPVSSPPHFTAGMAQRVKLLDTAHIRRAFARYKTLALLIAIAILWGVFSHFTDGDFLTARNFSNLLRQMSITGMLACGMVFVIISGEIDLSVGSMLGLLGGLAAILDVSFHMPLVLNVLIIIVAGAAIGAFNGYWVAYLRIPSFIVTLAGLLALRGILLGITGGATIAPVSPHLVAVAQDYLPPLFGRGLEIVILGILAASAFQSRANRTRYNLATAPLWLDIVKLAGSAAAIVALFAALDAYRGVPLPVLAMLFFLAIFTVLAQRTTFGRRIYAIGGNLEATRLSGVNVKLVKLSVFSLMGVMAALAGISTTARLAAGSPSAGSLQELDAIAACIIGGTSMRGGAGTVFGALIGALMMATLDNGMSMLGVEAYWQMIVKGTILLAAVWLDVVTNTKE